MRDDRCEPRIAPSHRRSECEILPGRVSSNRFDLARAAFVPFFQHRARKKKREKNEIAIPIPLDSARFRKREADSDAESVSLTVTYRCGIVLGNPPRSNTRGGGRVASLSRHRGKQASPRRHHKAICSVVSARYRGASSNMPSNPRNHQYLFVSPSR